jgi:hypothetical protein
MLAPWASEEMKTAKLPDKRLNERLAIVLSQLAGQPTASIPAACGGYAETAAAYRLFENERLSFEDVLQPHIDATRRRVAEQPLVILAQDTTELDFTRPQQQVVGAGPMDGSKRRGAFLHPLHAFTPDGVPLGTVAAHVWTRPDGVPQGRAGLVHSLLVSVRPQYSTPVYGRSREAVLGPAFTPGGRRQRGNYYSEPDRRPIYGPSRDGGL